MKKLLLLTSLLTMTMGTTMAQGTEGWTVGEDVSQYLEWGDYDGTTNDGGFWQGTGATFDFNEWEIFQGSDVDRYQLVWIPAGVYEFRCQGFYRDGGNGEAAKNYFTGASSKNAVLYAETGTGDLETFEATKTYSRPLMSQWAILNTTHYFETTEWTNDASYTYNEVEYWAPNCMEGTSIYFADKLYDENIVKFVVMEDGYVKLGIRKPGSNIPSDWLIFTNFRIIYQGDAGEAAALMMAEEDYETIKETVFQFEREILAAGYEGLAGIIEDAVMEIDGELEPSTVEEFENGTALFTELYEKYKKAYADAKMLNSIIANCERISASTDFSGLDAFNTAINKAKGVANADVFSLSGVEDFTNALSELLEARGAYLMSQTPNEDGSFDFSRLIANPFFCNDEYTPTWNGYQYVYTDQIESEWFGENKAWELNAEIPQEGRTVLADNVIITTDPEAENVWVVVPKTTSGYLGGYGNVIWTQGYTAVQQWGPEASGGYCEFHQVLNGLPNGYYSASAMIINDGREITPGAQHVFISNGEEESLGIFDRRYGGWWGNSRDGWQTCTTSLVEVTNGKVTIGMRNNNFYAGTGFSLTYYGAQPNFSALLAGDIAAAKEDAETRLFFPGDIKAFNEIIGQIPETIEDYQTYDDAKAKIAEAKKYTDTAANAINSWSAIDDFAKLLDSYEEGTDEYEVVNTAFTQTLSVGEGENDTYLDAIASGKDYTAYVDYLSYYDNAKGYADGNTDLATLMASQIADLKANYANAEKLAEYKAALAVPYNAALLASLNAGSATESNPVDVTALLVNPSFENGTKGWDGALTVDNELQNAERYDTNFDVSQTVYALPAGAYRVEVTSFYRDGGVGGPESGAYMNWNYIALGDVEYWDNPNVVFYANTNGVENTSIITSICNANFTEPSFTEYISSYEEAEEPDEEGNIIMLPVYTYINLDEPAYPFDNVVIDGDDIFWYPNSMRGAYYAFQKPGAYKNSVEIMVEEGQSLTFGLRKEVTIGGDWCMFDDFKLFYLGKDAPSSVKAIETSESKGAEYFSVSGARLNGAQKGVNIVRMSDGSVKKVYKK